MKDKDRQRTKNVSKSIVNFLKTVFIEMKIVIKNLYKAALERLRLSIILKLSLTYLSRLINIFFLLDFILILMAGGLLIYKTENSSKETYQRYFQFIKYKNISDIYKLDENDKVNLNLLKTKNYDNITIYDEENKEVYTTFKKDDKKNLYKITEDIYLQVIDNLDKEYLKDIPKFNSTFNPKYTCYYIKKMDITIDNSTIHIDIYNDITEDIVIIIAALAVLTLIEAIMCISSVLKSSIATRKVLKPIEEMNNTIKEITINNIDTRLNIMGSQNELKDLANTFNSMLDRIQQSYEVQNQFVSDASHELRTPISVIQGYAKMLNRWGKDDKDVLEESILAIESESKSMKSLIEQLLFLARGDKDTQNFNKENFHLNILIDEIIKETKLINENRHIIKCDRNDDVSILADRNLLKEALRIFMDNSIKYTKEGGEITMSSYVFDNKATIVIKDTGIGISKEDLAKVFDRFYRADKSRTRETGGTGLGLSIAKWIIMKHKGRIEVSSKIDIGTTFMIKIPIQNKI